MADIQYVSNTLDLLIFKPYSRFSLLFQFVPVPALDALPHGLSPYLMVGGAATKVVKDSATWDVPVKAYSMGEREGGEVTVKAYIPDSPRYTHAGKPVPAVDTQNTYTGVLQDIVPAADKVPFHVLMEIKEVGFLRSNSESKTMGRSPSNGMFLLAML